MKISTELLPVVLAMKEMIEKNQEPDGNYCVKTFQTRNEIEFHNSTTYSVKEGAFDLNLLNSHIYHRSLTKGDSVSVSYQNGISKDIERRVVWTERIADPELYSLANTKYLPPMLYAGECIPLVTDISDDVEESREPHFTTYSYVTIPEGYVGIIKHPDVNGEVGSIVVTPDLETLNKAREVHHE